VETPRDISFCGHTILTEEPLIVQDALQDERFFDNPLVLEYPNIRFYGGQPLKAPDGRRVGVLCIIDTKPREVIQEDLVILRDLGELVEEEFKRREVLSEVVQLAVTKLEEVERRAAVDWLTRTWGRKMTLQVLDQEVERARKHRYPISVALLDLDHFKQVNDTLGHLAGDAALKEVALRLRTGTRPEDTLGRIGGEEFLFILPKCGPEEAALVGERLRSLVASEPVLWKEEKIPVTVSIGICSSTAGNHPPESLIGIADQALYQGKENGRDRVVLIEDRGHDRIIRPPPMKED
jgi:diguanylate cyclase (GGDEF)-like protein